MTAGEILIARGHEQGLQKGIEQGLEQGRRESFWLGIETICEVLGIELDASRRAEMDRLDAAGLEAMLARLKTTRAWG